MHRLWETESVAGRSERLEGKKREPLIQCLITVKCTLNMHLKESKLMIVIKIPSHIVKLKQSSKIESLGISVV